MFIGSKLVCASTDVIIPTEVDVIGEVLARHHFIIVSNKTIDSVEEAEKLDVTALGLEPKQTVDNVIATWCLSTHVN
jgi:hypothetical protein